MRSFIGCDVGGMFECLNLHSLSLGNMGKNKQKGKKQKNVFQVANSKQQQKSKKKAKPVTSSLKHVSSPPARSPPPLVQTLEIVVLVTWQIKALKNEKVENLNQMFTRVQRDVTGASKPAAAEAKMQVRERGRLLSSSSSSSSSLFFLRWLVQNLFFLSFAAMLLHNKLLFSFVCPSSPLLLGYSIP